MTDPLEEDEWLQLGLGVGPQRTTTRQPILVNHTFGTTPFVFPSPYHHHLIQQERHLSNEIRALRSHNSGVWCMLQASQTQGNEPFLPQIQKRYLRIRDGKMPVRLVMKYLMEKLDLHHESEVEISCRGQEVLPLMSMQHVRDHVWRDEGTVMLSLLPNSPTTEHVMVLTYARTALLLNS